MGTKFFAACAAFAALSGLAAPAQAISVFAQTGDFATVSPVVDDFRAALGALNAPDPVNASGGRRQIDWDGAPDAVSDPNAFPGDFFNTPVSLRARGISFSTPGTGFQLSSTATSGEPTGFGFTNSGIVPFSPERLFSPVGSNVTLVDFFDPLDGVGDATTRGLGVVFVDIEDGGSSSFELFDLDGDTLFSADPGFAGNALFSFVGVVFDDPIIASARIVTGTSALLGGSLAVDGVAMDDFIFGEPTPVGADVPLPAAAWMMLAGLGALDALRRRRRVKTGA